MAVRPDNRLADRPMVPVQCEACNASVLARKSSWEQTSLQWSEESMATCLERRADTPRPGPNGGAFLSCSALRDSVRAAVRRGEGPVQIDGPLKVNPEHVEENSPA